MKELHHRGATATERIARWTMSRVHLQAGQFKNSIYFKTDDRETMQQFLPLSYKNWPAPASYSFIFGLFKQTIQFLQQIFMKKCPSSIRCRDSNPRPLESESLPISTRQGLPPISTPFLIGTFPVSFEPHSYLKPRSRLQQFSAEFTEMWFLFMQKQRSTYYHRRLLLKLDTHPCSHLVVEVCIQWGMCTVPHPLQVLCLIQCKNRPVDGTTDLLV